MKINTTPGETYIVLSTGGCTVTTGAGDRIKRLAAGQDFFTAMTGNSIISDDNASVIVATGEILSMLNTDGTGSEVQATLHFQPVTSQSALPATGENGVIYLVPNGKTAPNQYTEWVWTGAAYEQLGDVSVDLSGYASKADLGITSISVVSETPILNIGPIKVTLENTSLILKSSSIELGATHRLTDDGYMQLHNIETDSLETDSLETDSLEAQSISVLKSLYMPAGVLMKLGLPDGPEEIRDDYIGTNANRYGIGRLFELSVMSSLNLSEDINFDGDGWQKLTSQITAATVATIEENDKESFTKLIFPPTGTATAEQDPSWITKSHILMETNGGQLNMTQLTATLAYAAQTPLAIAKKTLWLSTSPGTGDAVQWPANAVFPDDQPQDKIQQLNSNSTYWFDITYVGGSDTVLIRKVCSWASTTGESGPTE